MIPGYAVDPETEAQVWEVFQTWSPHFKARLAESGIPGLLHRYENLVERVENAISSGSTLYYYDYDHWLTTRDVLEILVEHAPTGLSQEDAASIAALDARLEPLIRPGKSPLVHGRTHESCWWHQGLPPCLDGLPGEGPTADVRCVRCLHLSFETPVDPHEVARALGRQLPLTAVPGDFLDAFLERRLRICKILGHEPARESPVYRSAEKLAERHRPGLQFTVKLEGGKPIQLQVCRVFAKFARKRPFSPHEESLLRATLSTLQGQVRGMVRSGLPSD